MRRGFTLLELLVAVGVFIVGFVSAYALFLTAVRNRAQAEAITRTSLAATSLLAEMRLVAGREEAVKNPGGGGAGAAPVPPREYGGDGFAYNGQELTADGFVRYPDQAGIWYLVIRGVSADGKTVSLEPTDLAGSTTNTLTVGIKLALVIMHCPVEGALKDGRYRLNWATLAQRFRLSSTDPAKALLELRDRRLVHVYEAVIHRQASWLP
jgi:prepilin-type N-terminal cleavage/methylation domain-containing protein